jgi:predicted dehydrogenase
MENIRKAIVVGNGNISLIHRKNLKLLFPKIFIITVPSNSQSIKRSVEFADQTIFDLNDAVKEKVDMAIVASPASLHAMHAKTMLLAGIPTLIEKPVTNKLVDAQELIALQSKTGSPVSVGYCLRYLPSSIKMKELIDQKIIGNIYNVFVSVGQYLPDWRPSRDYRKTVSANKSLGGGALLELSHEIDYVQWLLGQMSVQYAQVRSSSELNLEVEELADMILVSDAGTVCYVHMDFLQKKANRVCSFIGEKGRIDWDLLNNKIQLQTKEHISCLFDVEDWDSNEMYLSLLKDFLNLVAGRENSSIDLVQATKTIQLIEAIKKVATKGIKQ